MKVKVIGAGSIGNHLSQAARRVGWEVVVVDRDPEALRRMREEIYPARYGAWDSSIEQFTQDSAPIGGFDAIFIGTPPHVRMPLALAALKEQPRILQLEKPLCTPSLEGLHEFIEEYNKQSRTAALMGYDHAISISISRVLELLESGLCGETETVDVEFREHWGGIFKAHPWLSGPSDSYLGFTEKGGGASGEHSHALHLWQLLSRRSGLGMWKSVLPTYKKETSGGGDYDSIAAFSFVTDTGKVGRVVQDVVTSPTRKWARIQGKKGFIEWICGGDKDVVRYATEGKDVAEEFFPKKRPDDFYQEMLHIQDILSGKINPHTSPISLESGIEVMKVLHTASHSGAQGVQIQNV